MTNMEAALKRWAQEQGMNTAGMQLPDVQLSPEVITVMMVSEAPPADPKDGFYSPATDAAFAGSALSLFRDAGMAAHSMQDVVREGIYVTTALKTPKEGLAVDKAVLATQVPILRQEMRMLPNLQVLMLMGDAARLALNLIAKAETGKNALPATSTYKIRQDAFFYDGLRVFPSYILAGKNLAIEKSKCGMIVEDIQRMLVYRSELKNT